MTPVKVAIIGLDTSHSVIFPKLMQDPEMPEKDKVPALRAVSCLRFPTPFQSREGMDQRQAYLESIGVPVTENFDEAVADCDALILAINDPAFHLEYFEKCAPLGKPIFLDKPFADSLESMHKIIEIARKYKVCFFTASSLRFDADLADGIANCPAPQRVTVWAPIGKAAAGSDIIWYGCHAFEMLQKIMGKGAVSVDSYKNGSSYVFLVSFTGGRSGTVELTPDSPYGAFLRDEKFHGTVVNVSNRIPFYRLLLQNMARFFRGEKIMELEDSVEVMAMLCAADRAVKSGKTEKVTV